MVPPADIVGIVLYRYCHTIFSGLEGLLLLQKSKKKSEKSALYDQFFRFASLQAVAILARLLNPVQLHMTF